MQNYRPISVLPMMSKIFEKCIHKRLIDFCSHFSIINPNQYGFQTGKSTELAVIQLLEYLYDVLNSKQFSLNIFVDFCKAFDSIDHKILL